MTVVTLRKGLPGDAKVKYRVLRRTEEAAAKRRIVHFAAAEWMHGLVTAKPFSSGNYDCAGLVVLAVYGTDPDWTIELEARAASELVDFISVGRFTVEEVAVQLAEWAVPVERTL